VYKLGEALLGVDSEALERDLDLVALATISGVVPLVAQNRALARAGLRALAAREPRPAGADARGARRSCDRRRGRRRLPARPAHQRRRAPVPAGGGAPPPAPPGQRRGG